MNDNYPKIESNKGVRWLAVFEQFAAGILIAAAVGIGAVYINTVKTNEAVTSLLHRFERYEQRITNVENDVKSLQIEMARHHRVDN